MANEAWSIARGTVEDIDTVDRMSAQLHALEHIEIPATQRRHAINRLLCEESLGGIWLIAHHGQVVGYIALCRGFSIEFGGYDAVVDELFMQPEFRGSGGGRFALEAIKAEASRLDIRALHLEVDRGNSNARQLYEKVGFSARDKYVLMTTG